MLGTSGSQTGEWRCKQIEGALNSLPVRLRLGRSKKVQIAEAWSLVEQAPGEAEAACTIGTRLNGEATSQAALWSR